MCEYSVSKIEYFQYFFPQEIIWSCEKTLHHFDLPTDKKIRKDNFPAEYYWFLWTVQNSKKKFLIDAHVKTPIRIILMSEFCLKLLNLLQGVSALAPHTSKLEQV